MSSQPTKRRKCEDVAEDQTNQIKRTKQSDEDTHDSADEESEDSEQDSDDLDTDDSEDKQFINKVSLLLSTIYVYLIFDFIE